MLFDCGHKADSGQLTRNGILCSACAKGHTLPIREELQRTPFMIEQRSSENRESDVQEAIDLLKKRLPSDWPVDKLEKMARRLLRAQTVRAIPGEVHPLPGVVNDNASPKSSEKGPTA